MRRSRGIRALLAAVAALALAGCCGDDTTVSASWDLSVPVMLGCPATFEDVLHTQAPCVPRERCYYPVDERQDGGAEIECTCTPDGRWGCPL